MKGPAKLEFLKARYDENKLSVYSYAAVCLGSDCVSAVAETFLAASRRIGALRSTLDPNFLLLTLADDAVKKAKPSSAPEGGALAELCARPLNVRRAWALRRLCGLSTSQTAKLMRVSREEAARLFDEAGSPDEAAVKSEIKRLSASADAWGQIEYMTGQSAVRARRLRNACLAALALIVGALLVREGYAAVRIFTLPREAAPETALTASADASQHWSAHDTVSADGANMDARLFEQLSSLDGETPVRVDFTFYDEALVRSVTDEDGKSVYELVTELYEESSLLSSALSISCGAVSRYYSDYEFDIARSPMYGYKSGFESRFSSYYEALLEVAGGRNSEVWERLLEGYPEVFGSEEGFESFLYSDYFLYNCPGLRDTLIYEREHRLWLAGEYEYEEGRDPETEYELMLYSFFNAYGGRYRYNAALTYPNDISGYQASVRALGERIAAALTEAVGGFGFEDVRSEMYDFYDCSYFSAEMTAARALELAEDGRFFFKGLSYPDAPAGYPAGLEDRLALKLAYGDGGRCRVYLVDGEYRSLSYNFVVPVRLPEAFREAMREYMTSSRGAAMAFESDIGYSYIVLYGHERVASRYAILRSLFLEPDARMVLEEGTSFTRLLPL